MKFGRQPNLNHANSKSIFRILEIKYIILVIFGPKLKNASF